MLNLTDGYVAAVNHEGDDAYDFADAFVPSAWDGSAAGEAFDIAGGNPVGMRGLAEMMVGIAKRCGVRHDLCMQDRIMRFVSEHVLLERGVMMGLAMFFAGFVFMLGLLMTGSGCADLVVVSHGVNKGKGSAVRTSPGYAARRRSRSVMSNG